MKSKYEETRVNQRKLGVILDNGRKMSKYTEIRILKVIYIYDILLIVTKIVASPYPKCNGLAVNFWYLYVLG